MLWWLLHALRNMRSTTSEVSSSAQVSGLQISSSSNFVVFRFRLPRCRSHEFRSCIFRLQIATCAREEIFQCGKKCLPIKEIWRLSMSADLILFPICASHEGTYLMSLHVSHFQLLCPHLHTRIARRNVVCDHTRLQTAHISCTTEAIHPIFHRLTIFRRNLYSTNCSTREEQQLGPPDTSFQVLKKILSDC